MVAAARSIDRAIDGFEQGDFLSVLMLPRKIDESTGVSVSALKSEIVIEHAIVSANCL